MGIDWKHFNTALCRGLPFFHSIDSASSNFAGEIGKKAVKLKTSKVNLLVFPPPVFYNPSRSLTVRRRRFSRQEVINNF
jgi:hypothetical protein